jgi:hypothetical protein
MWCICDQYVNTIHIWSMCWYDAYAWDDRVATNDCGGSSTHILEKSQILYLISHHRWLHGVHMDGTCIGCTNMIHMWSMREYDTHMINALIRCICMRWLRAIANYCGIHGTSAHISEQTQTTIDLIWGIGNYMMYLWTNEVPSQILKN